MALVVFIPIRLIGDEIREMTDYNVNVDFALNVLVLLGYVVVLISMTTLLALSSDRKSFCLQMALYESFILVNPHLKTSTTFPPGRQKTGFAL